MMSAVSDRLPCLHRYWRPKNVQDFRRHTPPDLMHVRLSDPIIDVDCRQPTPGSSDWSLMAFGRENSQNYTHSIGPAPHRFIQERYSARECHRRFGGISISGIDFQAPHAPYVIEDEPGTGNNLIWRSSDGRYQKIIRRRHCSVTFDPLPEGFAIVRDKWPGHGLVISVADRPLSPTVETEFGTRIAVVPELQRLRWQYECTVLFMTQDEYLLMKAGADPPTPPKMDDLDCNVLLKALRQVEIIADNDNDANDAAYCIELLERKPNLPFNKLRSFFSSSANNHSYGLLKFLMLTAVAVLPDQEVSDAIAQLCVRLEIGRMNEKVRVWVPDRYPEVRLETHSIA